MSIKKDWPLFVGAAVVIGVGVYMTRKSMAAATSGLGRSHGLGGVYGERTRYGTSIFLTPVYGDDHAQSIDPTMTPTVPRAEADASSVKGERVASGQRMAGHRLLVESPSAMTVTRLAGIGATRLSGLSNFGAGPVAVPGRGWVAMRGPEAGTRGLSSAQARAAIIRALPHKKLAARRPITQAPPGV